jgi:putative RNA 2'-phosphotransferase
MAADAGKRLSWLLRHGALEAGLAMDTAGFADIEDVLRIAGLTRAELDRIVDENNKSRYEVRGTRVRACQGHSSGTPVTLEGLEASWDVFHGDALVFHGTGVDAARSILAEGIRSMERSHVHLAESTSSTVGKRAQVDVLLAVSPAALRARGLMVFRAQNGVLLVRAVPRDAIVDVIAVSSAGRRALPSLKG